MLCNVISLEAKQASNENWYVNIVAQPTDDAWAEELKYRMWCSKELAERLTANKPATIELRKVSVKVSPFQRVDDDGTINDKVFDSLTVVVRQHKGEDVDDAAKMANKLRLQLLNDGKIADVEVDSFAGAVGDLPE
jgi:hypothetical protein